MDQIEEILCYVTNIETDIEYVQELQRINHRARQRGVDIGNVEDACRRQIDELTSKHTRVLQALLGSIQSLVVLDRSTPTSTDVEDVREDVDILRAFRNAHSAIKKDKQALLAMKTQINTWNTEHHLTIVVTELQQLVTTIDTTYDQIVSDLSELVHTSREYANQIQEADVDSTETVLYTLTDCTSGGKAHTFREDRVALDLETTTTISLTNPAKSTNLADKVITSLQQTEKFSSVWLQDPEAAQTWRTTIKNKTKDSTYSWTHTGLSYSSLGLQNMQRLLWVTADRDLVYEFMTHFQAGDALECTVTGVVA